LFRAKQYELSGKSLSLERIAIERTADELDEAEYKFREGNGEPATRVHGIFADKCPVYRSLKAAIAMTTELTSNHPPCRALRDRLCANGDKPRWSVVQRH
jgi:hypothetical protein